MVRNLVSITCFQLHFILNCCMNNMILFFIYLISKILLHFQVYFQCLISLFGSLLWFMTVKAAAPVITIGSIQCFNLHFCNDC